jgi:hypothetical protein
MPLNMMSSAYAVSKEEIQMNNENDVNRIKAGEVAELTQGKAREAVQISEGKIADAAACFITNACVRGRGMADDCEILTVIREFRDGHMMTAPAEKEMVAHYYEVAPRIVAAIDAEVEPEPVYDAIYEMLVDWVESIKKEAFEDGLDTYKNMISDLTDRYCPYSTDRSPSVGTLSFAQVA